MREEMGQVVSMTGVKRTLKLNSGAVPKIESRNMFTDISLSMDGDKRKFDYIFSFLYKGFCRFIIVFFDPKLLPGM